MAGFGADLSIYRGAGVVPFKSALQREAEDDQLEAKRAAAQHSRCGWITWKKFSPVCPRQSIQCRKTWWQRASMIVADVIPMVTA